MINTNRKNYRYSCIDILLFLSFSTVFFSTQITAQENILTQISTIDALLSGIYDGNLTLRELKKYGDFGLGTFNNLDGEMFAIRGHFYQVTADGTVKTPSLETKTPFAAVTFFQKERVIKVSNVDYQNFREIMDSKIPTQNIFFAVQIEGTFQKVKTRSVPKQQLPYQPLKNVAKTQPTFYFNNVEGTMVGFRCPYFIKGINIPGYHLHFLTKDKKAGGHVLNFTTQEITVALDYITEFSMILPKDKPFYQANLAKGRRE